MSHSLHNSEVPHLQIQKGHDSLTHEQQVLAFVHYNFQPTQRRKMKNR